MYEEGKKCPAIRNLEQGDLGDDGTSEALRAGVVSKKNQILSGYHPVSRSGCHPS
jgi:hypothetical protein